MKKLNFAKQEQNTPKQVGQNQLKTNRISLSELSETESQLSQLSETELEVVTGGGDWWRHRSSHHVVRRW